ncbi:acyl-CoA thioesterase [bacterium]|nr:acyl-CoA thioesterase [bacterium]
MTDLLAGYPLVIEIPVAWGEMDSFQHVNNIVYFRYFESARIAYFERIGYNELTKRSGKGPILASTQCKFILPLTYPDKVSVAARVPTIESDRFIMEYLIVSQNHQKTAALGEGLVVSYDYRQNKKVELPDTVRNAILQLEKIDPGE